MVVVVIVVDMVTYVVARTMHLRTYELVGWTILVLLLLIRTSTQDPDPTGIKQVIKLGFKPNISMQQDVVARIVNIKGAQIFPKLGGTSKF